MSQIKALTIAIENGLDIEVKNVKMRRGHEGEPLYSCKAYFGKKAFATFEDLDWGHPDFNDIQPINDEILQKVEKLVAKLPTYYQPVLKENVKINLGELLTDLCIYKTIEKEAKRKQPTSLFNSKTKKIEVFQRSGAHTNETIQAYMDTLTDVIPFHKLPLKDVTEYFLRNSNIID